jgi:hypothetical protein
LSFGGANRFNVRKRHAQSQCFTLDLAAENNKLESFMLWGGNQGENIKAF